MKAGDWALRTGGWGAGEQRRSCCKSFPYAPLLVEPVSRYPIPNPQGSALMG